jgi:lipopolysaccharide cholinephosphotransferase
MEEIIKMNELMSESDLKRLHETEVEILDEVVRICEKYNLTYFFNGGTLLGAIRHKGFIPWDDDLDIGMPRKDYDKFIELCATELDSKYMLDNKDTNRKYYLNFAKIRKKNTIFEQDFQVNYDGPKGIWLDIFPYDNAKSVTSKKVYIQSKLNKTIFSLLHYKNKFFLNNKKLILKKIIRVILKPISNTCLLNLQDKILRWNEKKEEYKFFVSLSTTYDYRTELIEKDKYLPTIKMEFEGKMYNVPKEYDYILTKIYGDYMKLPPKEKRVTHNPIRLQF